MFECAGGGLAERTPSGAMGPLKRLGGAALDVFEHEPQVPPEFFALDNVVLVPHIASATADAPGHGAARAGQPGCVCGRAADAECGAGAVNRSA